MIFVTVGAGDFNSLIQAMDELAVVETIQPCAGIDALDPQSAEVALAIAAVAVGVEQGLQHRFIGAAEEPVPGAELSFGKFENFLVSLSSVHLRS